MRPNYPRLQDYEYRRRGTRNLFVIVEPLAGQRHVLLTKRRTKADFAHAVRYMVDDVPAAVNFYTAHLGFSVLTNFGAAFADVTSTKRGKVMPRRTTPSV